MHSIIYLYISSASIFSKKPQSKSPFLFLPKLPTARSIGELVIPHAGLGLGIGVVDSALVPLMATLVDTRHRADYATVYAIQQTSVSLAYALGKSYVNIQGVS